MTKVVPVKATTAGRKRASAKKKSASLARKKASSLAKKKKASLAKKKKASSATKKSASSAQKKKASSAKRKSAPLAKRKSASSAQKKKASSAQKKASSAQKKASSAKKKSASSAKKKASSAKKKRASPRARPAARTAPAAGTALVVVESPAKARTIAKYLGRGYIVRASVGHIKDLPKSRLGVDLEHGFEPEYVVLGDKKKVVAELRRAAKSVAKVFLAPDPDREGEAIAWHIAEELKRVNRTILRVRFNEITRKGVTEALAHPTALDTDRTDAQQARRILDRLVGYKISPLLWQTVGRGLSAGRVQSVTVRLLCEREAQIAAFEPQEYWSVDVQCRAATPPPFAAKIWRWDGHKAAPKTEQQAQLIAGELRDGPASVVAIDKKQRRRHPQPPFVTSKLQQEASRKLRFDAQRTMRLAQRLYEGVSLGAEGPVGLITYMRTDSTRVSQDALGEVRELIRETFGAAYLPAKPNSYKQPKRAQDAHEAIRPTSLAHTPTAVAKALGASNADQARLYRLIYERFVASQMAPAVYDQTTVDIARGRATVRATGQILRFAGFTAVYLAQETDDAKAEASDRADKPLPALAVGDAITITGVSPQQHYTAPPPRFTEATLVKELEERGIGRPSTYASILSTIVNRGYASKDGLRFTPTELGIRVNGLLVESFPEVLDTEFTAHMERELDKVEAGERDWRELVAGFYRRFSADLAKAKRALRAPDEQQADTEQPERPEQPELACELCGSPMAIKHGRHGAFLACEGYPDCRNTKELRHTSDGSVEVVAEPDTGEVCDECSAPMRLKHGRFGGFLACSRYPGCTATKPISLGIDCPRLGCDGFLAEKRSHRGKVFYGCSNYPRTQCDFVSWDQPAPIPCPLCEATFIVRLSNKSGTGSTGMRCLSCSYRSTEADPRDDGDDKPLARS